MSRLGDPDAIRLLTTLLRTRPATVAELRAIAPEAEHLVDQLDGFVHRDGDRLTYSDPAQVAGALGDLVGLLPQLGRDWARGGSSGAIEIELVHGVEEQWKAWARWAATHPPRAPFNVYPGMAGLANVLAPGMEDAVAPYPIRARAILPASAVLTDADRAVVDTLARSQMEVRLANRADSWFYSDPGVLWALPVVWGEYPPTSVVIGTDPVIGALVAALAESMWSSARPYGDPRPDWDDVLRLLGHGLPDKAIATALGVSQRTVERRIAEAMAHHGVGTRFELGAAWAAASAGPAQRNR